MVITQILKSLFLLTLVLALVPHPVVASSAAKPLEKLELRELGGLKSLFRQLYGPVKILSKVGTLRQQTKQQAEYSEQMGQWQKFQIVAAHVLSGKAPDFASSHDAFIQGKSVAVSVGATTRAMDRFVDRMVMLGYTPQEITDVISGRITLRVLQQSDRMRALGYNSQAISAYLERHYTTHTVKTSHIEQATGNPVSTPQHLDQFVVRHARTYGLDPNLVRAIITNESSWRVDAHSAMGAIGLMQLMPSTAQMLGIDPHRPDQNIEGGVRYLAGLLEMFEGDLDAALVSYNAGPTHARKWRRGDTVLYGETRNYLQRVKQSYAKLKM